MRYEVRHYENTSVVVMATETMGDIPVATFHRIGWAGHGLHPYQERAETYAAECNQAAQIVDRMLGIAHR